MTSKGNRCNGNLPELSHQLVQLAKYGYFENNVGHCPFLCTDDTCLVYEIDILWRLNHESLINVNCFYWTNEDSRWSYQWLVSTSSFAYCQIREIFVSGLSLYVNHNLLFLQLGADDIFTVNALHQHDGMIYIDNDGCKIRFLESQLHPSSSEASITYTMYSWTCFIRLVKGRNRFRKAGGHYIKLQFK